MKLKACIAAAVICLAQQGAAQSLDRSAAKAHCTAEWGTDYEMVNYCMEQLAEGNIVFNRYMKKAETDAEILLGPFATCRSKWGIEWDMIAYCAEQQVNGYLKLFEATDTLPDNISETIKIQCLRKWAPEYDMVGYCAEKQATAWRRLN